MLPAYFKGFALALFLLAGSLKLDPRLSWLPVDLTVLGGALVLGTTLVIWGRDRLRIPDSLASLAMLFVLFALPTLWTDWAAYPIEKVTKLFSFTLLAAIAPCFMLRERQDWRAFFHALAAFGLLLCQDALTTLVSGGTLYRLTAFGSNTIALGRGVGFVFLWYALWMLERKLPVAIGLPLVAGAGLVLTFSGSRGPFFSAIGILVLAGAILYRRQPKRLALAGTAVAALAVALFLGQSLAPSLSAQRIASFAQGDLGGSELARLDYYERSLATIPDAPLGIGWGGFAVHLSDEGGNDRGYPHNLLIETFLEAGWLPGLYLLVLLGVATARGVSRADSSEARAALALYLFFLCNTMVSGDLNDNKALLVFLALLLSLPPKPAAAEPELALVPELSR